MMLNIIAALLALVTPETSKLFEKRLESASGMVGYILKERIDFNQQSLYFTQKSMTDDGRFLVFESAPEDRTFAKQLAVIDFEKDEIIPLEGIIRRTDNQMAYLDVEKDEVWYLDRGAFYKRELLKDPQAPVLVCKVPESLTIRGKIGRLFTHLTLNHDRTKAYFDVSYAGGLMVQGLMDFSRGEFTEWSANSDGKVINHGEINPVKDNLALCAQEVTGDIKNIDGIYPRVQLNSLGKREVVECTMCNGGATHQTWAPDGKGYIYCGNGCTYHHLATDKEIEMIPGLYAAHANLSLDNKYLVFDRQAEDDNWYRGCPWNVLFWNRLTGKYVFVYRNSAALNEKGAKHPLHPDPHPSFGCRDRYIICTFNDEERRLNVFVAPVEQFILATQGERADFSTYKRSTSRKVTVFP